MGDTDSSHAVAASKSFSSQSPEISMQTSTPSNTQPTAQHVPSTPEFPYSSQPNVTIHPPSGPTPRQPRKLTSPVWNHFERMVVNGETRAKCLHCGQTFSTKSKNGTSHLKDHLELRCSRKHVMQVDLRQKLLSINRKQDSSIMLENHVFSQEVSRKELANMVILHEYPLSIVEHIGFWKFVNSLNPSFKIISRNTLKSDILKMFASEKANLKKLFDDHRGRVAITTDMWTTSNQKKGYMAITTHYIDDRWNLRNKTLRFVYVPCPHTANMLAQVLIDSLNMYNIAEKISSMVLDNCSTNDAMVDVLQEKFDHDNLLLGGNFLHVRCSAHILNLIVQDGLEVICSGIEKIRNCVVFWTATPSRVQKFEDKARASKIDCSKRLSLDCKIRWNSTYLMLISALPFKNVFANLKTQNPKFKFLVPTQRDWELAEIICHKLKKFHKVTELFSGRKYPTANLFFRQVCEIKIALKAWKDSDDEQVISDMAKKMMEKFDKYWSNINGILAIAAILDPRNKLECVDYYFNEIYGDDAGVEIERVRGLLYELLLEYQDKPDNENYVSSTSSSRDGLLGKRNAVNNLNECGDEEVDKWTQIKRTKKRKANVRCELDHYLEDDALPESNEFDVLHYWRIDLKFPILRKIAKDVLAIPASTVASESAFSMGGRVVSPQRSSLRADTVEALMCMQNWILGEYWVSCFDNAQACATILEDNDVEGDGCSSSEVVDVNSDGEDL